MWFKKKRKDFNTNDKMLTVNDDEHIPKAKTYLRFKRSPIAPLMNKP